MKFIKKHKVALILATILLILVCIFAYWFLKMLFPSGDSYGDRLDGIEEVAISTTTTEEIKNLIKANENVVEVTYDLIGKIITISVEVIDGTDLATIKTLTSESLLSALSTEEIAYYDLQIIITNENSELTNYPSIGYKHNTNDTFSWTNNG
ncbi:MAG: hypothetical protein R3Y21_05280 [Mycoplasmatota bacterium]